MVRASAQPELEAGLANGGTGERAGVRARLSVELMTVQRLLHSSESTRIFLRVHDRRGGVSLKIQSKPGGSAGTLRGSVIALRS